MTELYLRFDMRQPPGGGDPQALYETAIAMCEWAEAHGFAGVQLSEHHGSDDGYLPSPLVLAAAIAARTRKLRLRLALIVLPLNDPLKVAEDLAVLDILSGGRVEAVFGAGYVVHEFAMFGVEMKQRPALMAEGIEAIRAAWSGEAFYYRGRSARVTPRPLQRPHPPIWMGGNSAPAARRAARHADYFLTENRGLYEEFAAARRELGKPVPPFLDIGSGFLVATPDVEAEWARMTPWILHECNGYAKWQAEGAMSGQYFEITDVAPLRASGLYPILDAEAAIDYVRARGAHGQVCLHPLISGMPPEIGWEQLRYFAEKVLPGI